jgi:FG-GAP repeat
VNGDYLPVTGDFDGDGRDDIAWYGPGGLSDSMWWGGPSGFVAGTLRRA